MGIVNNELMKFKITFHVVNSDFSISTDGIIGRGYLRQEKVETAFWHNTIATHSNPKKSMLFIDNEFRVALENTTDY